MIFLFDLAACVESFAVVFWAEGTILDKDLECLLLVIPVVDAPGYVG